MSLPIVCIPLTAQSSHRVLSAPFFLKGLTSFFPAENIFNNFPLFLSRFRPQPLLTAANNEKVDLAPKMDRVLARDQFSCLILFQHSVQKINLIFTSFLNFEINNTSINHGKCINIYDIDSFLCIKWKNKKK